MAHPREPVETSLSLNDENKRLLGEEPEAPVPAAEPKKTWHQCPWKKKTIIQISIFLVIVGVIVFLIVHFDKQIDGFIGNGGTLQRFVQRIGWWGPLVYLLVYAACTVLFIPGSLLTLGAGVVFHTGQVSSLFLAFGVVSIGSTIGALLAFLLGRFVFRSWVQGKIAAFPKFKAVEKAIGENGFKIVFLLRLSPVFPFTILNYALGITTVKFLSYFVASWLGMIPGTFLYVYIGWAAIGAVGSGTASSSGSKTTTIVKDVLLYGVGTIVTIAVVVLVTIIARRAIKKAIEESEAREAAAAADASRATSAPPALSADEMKRQEAGESAV